MQEVYNNLLKEIERLIGKEPSQEDKEDIFNTYIYTRVSDEEMNKALKKNPGYLKILNTELPEGLQFEPILNQTLKIIGVMEVSEAWEDFEKLQGKRKKKPKKELTDFDKILKGITKVPKQDKTKE
jgi:hypothetical protein